MKKLKKFLCVLLSVILLSTTLCINSVAYADELPGSKSVNFGMYPQTLVTDNDLITQLNHQQPEWLSYNYYAGKNAYGSMSQSDFMKYADVEYNGAKYRAVMFTQYRPDGSINAIFENASAYQYINGYEVNHIYWFKFEPIKWYILDENSGLIMSADILDAQPFSNTIYQKANEYFSNRDCTVYANNYALSYIKEWLNDDFYHCAFNQTEKSVVKSSTVDMIEQKVFLLSANDITNSDYGFNSDKFETDPLRITKGSDYSKAQGLYVETVSGAEGNSYWNLRSAASETDLSSRVTSNGFVSANYVYNTSYAGVRPAVQVDLHSCIIGLYEPNQCTHHYAAPKITNATCTANGKKEYICTYCSYKHCEPIKVLGHSYTSKIVKKATCTEKGKKQYTCSRCSHKYSASIPALGHKYKTKVVKPTYFAEGYTLHTCSQCKKSYKDKKKAKLKVKTPSLKKLTAQKKSIKVSWSKVKSVQGYEIQYSTDKKFKKNTKTVKIKKGSATSKTISKLKKNKKYYVRVRAYKYQNKKYARSSWSKVKSIKVK